MIGLVLGTFRIRSGLSGQSNGLNMNAREPVDHGLNREWRTALLAAAFMLTATAVYAGATLSGQTHETTLEQTCARMVWPNIPSECLQGASDRAIRYAASDRVVEGNLAARFAVAFD